MNPNWLNQSMMIPPFYHQPFFQPMTMQTLSMQPMPMQTMSQPMTQPISGQPMMYPTSGQPMVYSISGQQMMHPISLHSMSVQHVTQPINTQSSMIVPSVQAPMPVPSVQAPLPVPSVQSPMTSPLMSSTITKQLPAVRTTVTSDREHVTWPVQRKQRQPRHNQHRFNKPSTSMSPPKKRPVYKTDAVSPSESVLPVVAKHSGQRWINPHERRQTYKKEKTFPVIGTSMVQVPTNDVPFVGKQRQRNNRRRTRNAEMKRLRNRMNKLQTLIDHQQNDENEKTREQPRAPSEHLDKFEKKRGDQSTTLQANVVHGGINEVQSISNPKSHEFKSFGRRHSIQ